MSTIKGSDMEFLNQNFTNAEQAISKVILDNYQQMRELSIIDIANEANVSKALVVKFCKKCGFTGFKELKYYIENTQNREQQSNDFIDNQELKINNFFQMIRTNPQMIDQLVNGINQSDYVVMYGKGPSLGVAKYFAPRLSSVAKKPIIVQEDEQLMQLELRNKTNKCIIFLSASLKTGAILEKINIAQASTQNTFVISENINSEIYVKNQIILDRQNPQYNYEQIRDRSLFFIYLELVVNKFITKR